MNRFEICGMDLKKKKSSGENLVSYCHVINGFLTCNNRSYLYSFIVFFEFPTFWTVEKCYLVIMYMYY